MGFTAQNATKLNFSSLALSNTASRFLFPLLFSILLIDVKAMVCTVPISDHLTTLGIIMNYFLSLQ